MPNYRNTRAVGQDLGSSRMALIQHDTDFALSGDLIFLPVIETSNINNAVATLSREDEEGITYQADGAKTVTKTITIMQKDKDALRLPKLLEGNTYAWVKEMSRVADPNGDYTYEIGVGAKISQNYQIDGKGGSTTLTFNITPNDVDVTFPLASFDDSKFLGDLGSASAFTLSADDAFDYTVVSPA